LEAAAESRYGRRMPDAPDLGHNRPFDIETLPVDLNIGGREGLDVNHASRLRMQFLVSQQASLVAQTQFADAKAGALMALLGLVALNGPVKLGGAGSPQPDALAIFILMIGAIGFAVWAIIPRFPKAGTDASMKQHDRFSWPALASRHYDPMEHATFMRTAEASQLVMSIAHSNATMARVLRRKFVSLRIAFLLASADLLLIMLYVVGLRLA
jgi:Family of unknown function (DUF5706)